MCFFFIPRHSAILFCRSFHHHQNFCSLAPAQSVALPLAFNVRPEQFGPEKTNPLVIVPGLFGHKSNWRGIASALQKELQNRIFVVDMRNHGESPHCSDSTYPSMALDLRQFIEQEVLTRSNHKSAFLLGHSMGGKVVAEFAMDKANADLIEKLVIEDIAPQRNSHSSLIQFRTYIDALRSVDLRLSRRQISKALEPSIREEAVRAFLLTNLCQDRPGLYKWRCNLDALSDNLEHLFGHKVAVPDKKINMPTLFLYGANSTYCSEVPEAGHWIHSEQPQLFIESVTRFLRRGYITYNE
uniref:sn-1-specific diacylglycerol lipase ABHD11 n=1 Tax=Globodera rostochiensis TaxID=31243 RepID=A0A914I701_GLORO